MKFPSKKEIGTLLTFACRVLQEVGEVLINEQQKFSVVDQKDILDIATTADLKAEKLIISSIQKQFPDHKIVSEEKGTIEGSASFTWYVDPLDGTKEYVRNLPFYNTCLALEFENELILSALYQPQYLTLFSAGKGLGAFRNGKKVKTSNVKKLEEAIIYCYLPSYKRNKSKYEKSWESLVNLNKEVYRLRSMADENSAMCFMGAGSTEGYLNISNPPKAWHDAAPGVLFAREAGGVVTDTGGREVTSSNFDTIVAVANRDLHKLVLDKLDKQK